MSNVMLVLITALISGLLATLITLWWQHKMALRSQKMRIFETLMSHRYMLWAEESVQALNSIDVVFYKDTEVRRAYAAFLNESEKSMENNSHLEDMHLKLLEEMAKALNLSGIHWDDIKRKYYPTGLAEKIQDEQMLRKLQIENALKSEQFNDDQSDDENNE